MTHSSQDILAPTYSTVLDAVTVKQTASAVSVVLRAAVAVMDRHWETPAHSKGKARQSGLTLLTLNYVTIQRILDTFSFLHI